MKYLLLLALSGCSFFGKQEPMHPQYFDPEPGVATTSGGNAVGKSLRLGHVTGASYLREKIAYHTSERELGFYDKRRWTERPEVYLRRTLSRELFEHRGLTQVALGAAPTLEVELVDFSEYKKPTHEARLRARVLLVDARNVRFEKTFEVAEEIKGEEFDRVPQAFSTALTQLVGQIADRLVSELPAAP